MYWVASCGHSWDPSWPISRLSLLNTCSAQEATGFGTTWASATSPEDPPSGNQQERHAACFPDITAVQEHAQPSWEDGQPHLPRHPERQPQLQPLNWRHPDALLPATTAAPFRSPAPLAARQRCSPLAPDPCSAGAPGTGPVAGQPSAAARPAGHLQHIASLCGMASRAPGTGPA